MDVINSTFSTSDVRATNRGTKIVKPGSEMDKNAFLRILTAELTNQDPMNTKDSTEYVAQMAQFSSMEQMSNLNATMSSNAANSLIGKGVILSVNDENGNAYTGTVRDVTNNSGEINLGIEISANGKTEIRDFDLKQVKSVYDIPNNTLDFLSGNTALLTAASFIGKRAELLTKDASGNNITGLVKGMTRDGGLIKLRILPDNGGQEIMAGLDDITKLDMV